MTSARGPDMSPSPWLRAEAYFSSALLHRTRPIAALDELSHARRGLDRVLPRTHAELAVEVLEVGPDGLGREHVGRGAAGQQVQDLPLAVGQVAADGPQADAAERGGAVVLDELHGELARDRRLALEAAAERAGERVEVHVLREEAGRAGAQATHPERLVGGAGEEDHPDLGGLLIN